MSKGERVAVAIAMAGMGVGLGIGIGRVSSRGQSQSSELARRLDEQGRRLDRLAASWTGTGLAMAGATNRMNATAALIAAGRAPAAAPEPGAGAALAPEDPDDPKGAPAIPSQDSAAQDQAVTEGQQMVDAAIGLGRWTEPNYHDMHRLMSLMRPQDRDALARRIAVAINQAKLKPDDLRQVF